MNNIVAWVSIGVTLIFTGFNAALWLVVKFNDMKHMADDLKEIKGGVKNIQDIQKHDGERLATIEGRCKANHGE